MTNNAQKPDTPPPMAGMDHAAMGHGAKSSIDHAAMGLGAKSVDHAAMGHAPQGGGADAGHGDMVADFRRRFWVCLVLTIPVLVLSPMVRDFLGQGMAPLFAAEEWVALALSSIIYFWGGWPGLLDHRCRAGGRRPLAGRAAVEPARSRAVRGLCTL